VHRVYDRAQTPYHRLCASGVLPPRAREDLEAALDHLWSLAAPDPHRQGHTEIATPSAKSAPAGAYTMAPVTLNYELTSTGG
jgi:hypothetical protein